MEAEVTTRYRVEYANPQGELRHRDFIVLAEATRFCDRLENRMVHDRCDGYEIQEVKILVDRWI